jgi:hypothetical protein
MKRIQLIALFICASLAGFAQEAFVSFEGSINKEGAIELSWSTNNQAQLSHFEIQRSIDGREWVTEAIIFADARASVLSHKYTRKSYNTGNLSYRIRQIQLNGEASYSHIEIFSTGDASRDGERKNADAYVVQLKDATGATILKRVAL